MIITDKNVLFNSKSKLEKISVSLAEELFKITDLAILKTRNKNFLILTNRQIKEIRKICYIKEGRNLGGRPRIEVTDPSTLRGDEARRYKNRMRKREQRLREKIKYENDYRSRTLGQK